MALYEEMVHGTPETSGSHRWRMSLPIALVLGLGGFVALAAGSMLLLGYLSAERNTRSLLADRTRLTLEAIEDHIRMHLDPVRIQAESLRDILGDERARPRNADALIATFRAALAATPQVAGLAFIAPDLHVVRYNRSERDGHIEDWNGRLDAVEALQQASEARRGFWSRPVLSEPLGGAIIIFFLPVFRDGAFAGVLAPAIRMSDLSSYLKTVSQEREQTAFILLGRTHVLAHPKLATPLPALTRERPLPDLREVGDPVLAQGWAGKSHELAIGAFKGGSGIRVEVGPASYILLYREIASYGETPWTIGLHVPAAQIGLELDRLRAMGAVGVAMLGVSILAAALAGRHMGRPILRFAEAARRIEALDLAFVPKVGRSRLTELDEAARAFDAMATSLRWLQLYIPRTLVKRLLARDLAALPSDERVVTIMFTDLAGFSSLAARISPAEAADLLNHHFALIGVCIEEEGGTIDKFMGDGVMAFWGAPLPQADQASRACRAAHAIAAAVRSDNVERAAQGMHPMRVRIGLHTGPALVGNIGSPERLNYTIVGDTVNVADRVQELGKAIAPGDDIVALTTAATIAAAGMDGAGTDLGPHELRGRSLPYDIVRLV